MSRLGFLERREEYPRVTKRLELGRYNGQLKGNYIEVWLNWSREFNDRMVEYRDRLGKIAQMPSGTDEEWKAADGALDELAPSMFALNAEFWGCEEDEVRAIYEIDAELWRWIAGQANKMREDYREKRKKAGSATTGS